MQCREAMATVIPSRDLDLPTISPTVGARLYQHARTKLRDSRADEDHHGWEGAAPHLVGLATVTDPVSGTEVPFVPMVLMNGAVLCRVCHRRWEHHVRKEMGFHHTSKCPRDVDGRCLSCTTTDAKSRPKLRSLLIRDQIRDLTHALFSHGYYHARTRGKHIAPASSDAALWARPLPDDQCSGSYSVQNPGIDCLALL
jgi:hypothetical protein